MRRANYRLGARACLKDIGRGIDRELAFLPACCNTTLPYVTLAFRAIQKLIEFARSRRGSNFAVANSAIETSSARSPISVVTYHAMAFNLIVVSTVSLVCCLYTISIDFIQSVPQFDDKNVKSKFWMLKSIIL